LEAFAQFGSDLDKATQRQLNRGRRLVEILKQPQYKPIPAEKEVMILFAGAYGYLDEWPVEALSKYEQQMLAFMENKNPDLLQEIKEQKNISDELEAKLKKALDDFKNSFDPKA